MVGRSLAGKRAGGECGGCGWQVRWLQQEVRTMEKLSRRKERGGAEIREAYFELRRRGRVNAGRRGGRISSWSRVAGCLFGFVGTVEIGGSV